MGNASYRQTTATGASNSASAQDVHISYFQNDLPKFVYLLKKGDGKFMKTYVMRVDSTSLIVKVYMKLHDEELHVPVAKLTHLWHVLSPTKYPSLMPYQMWSRSPSAKTTKSPNSPVYLMRQYFSTNLHDRLSTRPFLNELEKLWFVFQLFKCLEICHEQGVVHGDIKPENIMCTSANWVILTDFSSAFKPCMIPDDDPTDFQYYFDSMGRHCCYIAPERFLRSGAPPEGSSAAQEIASPPVKASQPKMIRPVSAIFRKPTILKPTAAPPKSYALTPAMDVFSLGCVIAEVFLDGVPLLDLPGMLEYLSSPQDSLRGEGAGEGNGTGMPRPGVQRGQSTEPAEDTAATSGSGSTLAAASLLLRIKNPLIRELVIDMTQKDPSKRLYVTEYLDILQGNDHATATATATAPSDTGKFHIPVIATDTDRERAISAIFPSYFDGALYPLFFKLHWNGVTPDDRVAILCEGYFDLMRSITGAEDSQGHDFFAFANANRSRALLSCTGLKSEEAPCRRSGAAHSYSFRKEEDWPVRLGRRGNSSSSSGSGSGGRDGEREPSIDSTSYEGMDMDQLLESARAFVDGVERDMQAQTHLKSPTPQTSPGRTRERKAVEGSGHDRHHPLGISDDNEDDRRFSAAHDRANGLFDHATQAYPSLYGGQGAGLVLVVSILVANYRHLRLPQSKLVCLAMLCRLGCCLGGANHVQDGLVLQRILPTVALGLEDQSGPVKAMAVRCMRSLLQAVRHFSHSEATLFPLYVFPLLSRVARDSEICVKVAFAESLSRFAESAKRYLDQSHYEFLQSTLLKQRSGSSSSGTGDWDREKYGGEAWADRLRIKPTTAIDFPYEGRMEALKEQVNRWIRDLIVDSSMNMNSNSNINSNINSSTNSMNSSNNGSIVKRVLLADILRLCLFFGQEATLDKLLTQLLTFLNDPDWELRNAFCSKVVPVCLFLGPTVTAECILPCLENTIYDVEERVVVAAVHSLRQLVKLSLLSRGDMMEFINKCKALLFHPSVPIREAAIGFLVEVSTALEQVPRCAITYYTFPP